MSDSGVALITCAFVRSIGVPPHISETIVVPIVFSWLPLATMNFLASDESIVVPTGTMDLLIISGNEHPLSISACKLRVCLLTINDS